MYLCTSISLYKGMFCLDAKPHPEQWHMEVSLGPTHKQCNICNSRGVDGYLGRGASMWKIESCVYNICISIETYHSSQGTRNNQTIKRKPRLRVKNQCYGRISMLSFPRSPGFFLLLGTNMRQSCDRKSQSMLQDTVSLRIQVWYISLHLA